jgi:arylsulfatase A
MRRPQLTVISRSILSAFKPQWSRLGLLFVAGCIVAFYVGPGVAEARKPNVLVIFTDDQGSVDAGCYGAKDLQTPFIDSLSERGVRFSQFYAAAPVCSPSRAGLLTGRYPVRAGVPGNVPSQHGKSGMPADQVTIAETFRAAGYATAHIGKWHLGYEPKTMPGGQGFQHTFGHMGGCIDNFSHFFYWNGPNRHDLWRNGKEIHRPGEFFGDLMVEEASEFIEAHKDKPFFMYYAINMPHYPYQGDPEWLDVYEKVPYPRNLYNAFVSTFDARIGKLLSKLDSLGIRKDTIVVFQSDHGHSTEVRAHNGGGDAGPFRGAKFSLFEGGIRVPAIISWPGHLPEGESREQIAHSCDWLPTLTELCDIPLLRKDIDGKSIAALAKSNSADSPHETIHWTIGNSWAVRSGVWKLIGNPRDTSDKAPLGKDDKLFLTNLKHDLSEMKNIASQHPDQVKRLSQLHQSWKQGLGK